MDISVIVPNQSDMRMADLFSSFDAFGCGSNFEFVLLLNRATADVRAMALRMRKEYQGACAVRIVETDIANLGHLYNLGLAAASFDDCLFVDSDMTCAPGAVAKLIKAHECSRAVTKGRIVFGDGSDLVRQARLVNTVEDPLPYIPVVLVNKNVFRKLQGDFVFAVDVVWCADAEFAIRVLDAAVPVTRVEDAEFYHASELWPDLRSAWRYGLGKGNRIKRTNETWAPMSEISATLRKARSQVRLNGTLYAGLWIALQQLACWWQLRRDNMFECALPFEQSMTKAELEETILEYRS